MSAGNAGQVLGVGVSLTGWNAGREDDVSGALSTLLPGASLPDTTDLPLLVVETTSKDSAEEAYDLLEAAGGKVEVTRVWMDPAAGKTHRSPCPRCGSTRTQPWGHAGPGARVNHMCDACGNPFKA
jgi:hypothetical protein